MSLFYRRHFFIDVTFHPNQNRAAPRLPPIPLCVPFAPFPSYLPSPKPRSLLSSSHSPFCENYSRKTTHMSHHTDPTTALPLSLI